MAPLPAWGYMFGRIVHAILVAVLLVVIVVAFGAIFYDATVPSRTLPASGSLTSSPRNSGSDAFAIHYVMQIDQLPSDARTLLRQLAAQTADEDANPVKTLRMRYDEWRKKQPASFK